jgi:cytohesin
MLKKHLAIPAFTFALLLSVGAPAHAQDTCAEVCTRDFWRNFTAEREAALREVGVNARDEAGNTPLHWAAVEGFPEDIDFLLEAGADVNARSEDGRTPLHMARWRGNTVTLLEAGADVNARNDNGRTPLHYAAEYFYPEEVLTLLEAGANVNARNGRGMTPMHYAALNRRTPENIVTLLEAGADIDARDERGWTPLHSAARFTDPSSPENVLALLEAGADGTVENEAGRTPFDNAAGTGALLRNEYIIGTDAYWALNEARFR